MEGTKGITRYIYDKEGGIAAEENPKGIRRYSYNSLHQQIWVCTEDGNVQENRYDAEGLRYEMLENGKSMDSYIMTRSFCPNRLFYW